MDPAPPLLLDQPLAALRTTLDPTPVRDAARAQLVGRVRGIEANVAELRAGLAEDDADLLERREMHDTAESTIEMLEQESDSVSRFREVLCNAGFASHATHEQAIERLRRKLALEARG